MNCIKQLHDNGMFSLIQAIAVAIGLIYAGYQLRDAKQTFQANIVSQISSQSAALQWEVIKDEDLRPLLGITGDLPSEQKRLAVAALVINQFATFFDLHQLDGIPEPVWMAFKADMKDTFASSAFQERWQQVKSSHRREFVRFVDSLIAE